MEDILLLVLGIVITVFGLVNISGNISTIHSYNRKNVKEEDAASYGRIMGTGTLIIGLAMIIAYVLKSMRSVSEEWVLIPGLVLGLAIMLYGQFRYNKGLF